MKDNNGNALSPGDIVWFAATPDEMPQTAEVVPLAGEMILVKRSNEAVSLRKDSIFLLEKWFGHGPFGDGSGMGPDGFDPNLLDSKERELWNNNNHEKGQ